MSEINASRLPGRESKQKNDPERGVPRPRNEDSGTWRKGETHQGRRFQRLLRTRGSHNPEGVKSAGRFVFQDCPEIKHIRIPSTLTDLSENAFFVGSEGALEEFFADQGNPAYRSEDGVLFTKDMKTLIQYPQKKAGNSYSVPDTVERIAPDAFAYCRDLESIILPEGLGEIGSGAFE